MHIDAFTEMINEVIRVAREYAGEAGPPQVAIEHGIAFATAGQSEAVKQAVRSELRKRGYRL